MFLKSPNTYKLRFLTARGREHSFLPKIKECALTGFLYNYTPDGNYQTYENSSMVAYEMSMSFNELEPIYHDDYTKLDQDRDRIYRFLTWLKIIFATYQTLNMLTVLKMVNLFQTILK